MRTVAIVFGLLAAGQLIAAEPTVLSAQAERGSKLYPRQCGICHLQQNFATGMLAKRLGKEKSVLAERNDLAPEYIRYIVRNGLQSMPAITRVQTTDEDLAAITAYLTRNNPAR